MEVDGKPVLRWLTHVGKRYERIQFSIEDVEAFLEHPEKAKGYLKHLRCTLKVGSDGS